jgi:ABC-type antimicrobial peptide transport system permease subunit
MKERLRILLCVLSGVAADVAVLALAIGLANVSIIWTFTHNHSHDPSAGDSAGWALVFLSPVILAIGVGVSVAAGFLAYSFVRRLLAFAKPLELLERILTEFSKCTLQSLAFNFSHIAASIHRRARVSN